MKNIRTFRKKSKTFSISLLRCDCLGLVFWNEKNIFIFYFKTLDNNNIKYIIKYYDITYW